MTHASSYRPAKPRIRLLPDPDRRRAATAEKVRIRKQIFTDWAAI